MKKRFPCFHISRAAAMLCLCLALLTPSTGEAAAPGSKGQLLLMAADSIPTAYLENGQATGLLVDVVREAFSRAGYSVIIELAPWARCIENTRKGYADGIFSIFNTPERQEFLDYTSQPIITQEVSFFVLKQSLVTFDGNFSSVSHYSIGVINQTSYGPRLDKALQKGIFTHQEQTHSAKSNIMMLLAGHVEITPSYRHVALSVAKTLGVQDQIRELSPTVESIPSYLAFNRKHDYRLVMADYEKALKSMQQDGKYQQIFDRYLR